ncbi:MAG: LuxR C-terminal-related transcriptional regulator [Chloroflexota bacterium]
MESAHLDGYLITKLIRPQIRSRRVARPRLLERLGEAARIPLTTVCAPAGYGKTTLLVEWMATCPLPASWLTLSAEDGDLARFLHYFILALQRLEASLGKSAQAVLNLPDREMSSTALRLLINDIAGMAQESLLVLDDYHWIDAPAVHEALAYLVENLPQNLHLVIASRTEPPLNLPRLRARAAVLELRLADLSFQPQEGEAFINDVMGLGMPPAACAQLIRQTEGWPAGLQLAALSLQRDMPSWWGDTRSPHHDGDLQAGAGQHDIFEFLAEEVLRRQPPDVQRFLLHTSILDSLTGPLCDALTAPLATASDGAASLEMLEHASLFTQALDGEHRWYRYHALFADFLRTRLQTCQPELVPRLHCKAARWLAAYGDFDAAYSHALAADELELAADLIEQCAETLERHGEITTLSRWLSPLPKELVARRPRLSLAHAWIALIGLDVKLAQSFLAQAEAALPLQAATGNDATQRVVAGELLAARAMLASLSGQVPEALRYIDAALACLPADQGFLISVLKFNLGFPTFLSGDFRQGVQALEDAVQAAEKSHTPFIALLALRLSGEGYLLMGRLSQAAYAFRRAVALVEQEWGKESPLMGVAWLGLGEVCRQRNQLEQAARYLEEGIDLCGLWMPSVAIDGYLWLSSLQQARGQSAAAQVTIQRARQISEGRGYSMLDEWFVHFATLRLNIIQGYLDEAQHWVHEAGLDQDPLAGLEERYAQHPAYFRQLIGYILARLWLVLGRQKNVPGALHQARQMLVHMLPLSETGGAYGISIEGRLLLAQVEAALGNESPAQDALHRALELAAPERPIRVFLDEGEAVKQLLCDRRRFDLPAPERAYIDELLTAWGCGTLSAPPAAVPGGLIEALTFRETEVLTLIAAGHSNQEIAAELVLSLHTVKRHVSSIMQKLGAKNRTEAVLVARQFNLLP